MICDRLFNTHTIAIFQARFFFFLLDEWVSAMFGERERDCEVKGDVSSFPSSEVPFRCFCVRGLASLS
jgi:hypothetical protein